MPNIGGWEIVIVVVLALLIFGPKKLPELGSSLGRSITGFKKGLKETKEDVESAVKEDNTTAAVSVTTATDTVDTDTKATQTTQTDQASQTDRPGQPD